MKYIYKAVERFVDERLLLKVTSACSRLHEKLSRVEPASLSISEYNQRYLASKLANLEASLALYAYLLLLCLSQSSKPFGEFVLIDYGGGIGLLSMLAKEIGIGVVLYNDIYDVSCRDTQRFSDALGLKIDHIVCGDIDDMVAYVQGKRIDVDALVTYDVIEHIYHIQDFFYKTTLLSRHQLFTVHASAANALNPFYVRRVRKLHRDREFKNRQRLWGWKERDTLRSYLDVRKEMIASFAPDLSAKQVTQLAKRTRGLRKNDIEKCVEEYRRTGKIHYRPQHPTNTCDPYTGNWAERLMKTTWLKETLEGAGFSVKIRSGYRACCGRLPIRAVRCFLNWTSGHWMDGRSLWFSPYYVLCADYCCGGMSASFSDDDSSRPVSTSVPAPCVSDCERIFLHKG